VALTTIEHGSLASSAVMNNNFEYLDNKISGVAETLASNTSGIYSNIASLSGTVSSHNSELSESIDNLQSYAENLRTEFEAQNNAPDYSRAIGISMPYSVTQDGYIYAGVDGIDNDRYVKVNGFPVHGHCGYSGGKAVYSGSLFRVCSGDTVTCDRTLGNYYFYPMKSVFVQAETE
jgi:hypothetical protein